MAVHLGSGCLLGAADPVRRHAMVVGYGDDEDMVGFNGIQEAIRELVKQAFSDVSTDNRPRMGVFRDSQGGFPNF